MGRVVVDERQQQAADAAAVDIGIAQDDDAAVAGVVEVDRRTGAHAVKSACASALSSTSSSWPCRR
jgi:hypothetical protein